MHYVCSCHEKDLAEVVLDVEVVIHEHVILFRIEHFEERSRRITTKIHRHFIDFVEHEDRVSGASLLHHLNNLSRQGSDISPPMAADLSLIADAAERHPDEFTAGCLSDGHAQ